MKKIADGEKLDRTLTRLAHEIVEKNDAESVILIGIRKRGVQVAMRMAEKLDKILGGKTETGIVDVTLYRDDILHIPDTSVLGTVINFDINGKTVVLCDDVLYTGRTVRAAISALIDFGRPEAIQLLVIADRGGREVPFSADYVGKNIVAGKDEKVCVRFTETDGENGIYILREGEDY